MLYREFYKKYVIRHSTGFLNPKITLGKDFQLPRMSTLHYITDNLSVTTPHETLPYFNKIKPIIYPVLEYKHTDAGHPKILNREAKIYNELKKSSKFKYVPYNSKTLTVKNRDLLVYNYGGLVGNYRYNPSPMNPYYRYKNLMTTVCERIKDIGREHYINIDVPDEIVNRQTLDRYVTGVTAQTLKLFNNMGLLILLDLWRLLNPDFRETSSFYHIKTDMYEKVHFIFNHNNRLVVVNLKHLLGLVAEYKIKIPDTPMSDSMVRKLLLSLYIQLSQVNLTIDLKNSGITEDALNNLTDATVDDVLDNFKYKRDKDIDDGSEEGDTEDSLKDIPVLDISILNKVEYKNTKAILEEKLDKFNPDKEKLDRLLKEGGISKLDYNKAIATIDKQNDDVSPYDSGVKLKEFLKYTKDEFEIKEEEIAVPEAVTSFDKTQLKDTQSVLTKKYIKETYKKDLVNTIYSLQKDNVYIEEYTVEEDESILGTTEIHTVRLKPINGKSSTIRIRLPKIEEDGTYMMSGNTYLMRKQRSDRPIRKIDSLSVALSSYYGKSFITKATYKKDDIGMWFQKSLLKASETNSKIKNLVLVGSKHADVKLPTQYTTIARYTKSFTLGDRHYYFGYNDRKDLVGKLDLSKVEGSKYIVVGREGNTPIVIDFNNKWYKYINGRYVEIDNLYTQLELDVSKMPLEFSNIKIFKQYIPVGVLMAYYLGFSSLIKTLGAKHRVLDKREKVELEEHEYVITFKDVKYVLDKREELNTIILGGLASVNKILKGIERDKLDNRTDFTLLLEKIISERLPIYINEFNMLETMFVDDITAHVLEEMKEPTTFKGLLIRGSELLLTEYYPHPNSIEGSVIKGYERIPGMVYTELIKSLREYKQKSQFMRAKIDMSPYAVWGTIGDDSTTMLIDDLNPMATLKQFEDLTYTGAGGRTATTMNKASRAWHPSEIGIISEGSKDSGDVGVTAYMSANPKIKNTRGFVDKFNYKQDGWTSIVTTNANMMAESIKDDPKRLTLGLLTR